MGVPHMFHVPRLACGGYVGSGQAPSTAAEPGCSNGGRGPSSTSYLAPGESERYFVGQPEGGVSTSTGRRCPRLPVCRTRVGRCVPPEMVPVSVSWSHHR